MGEAKRRPRGRRARARGERQSPGRDSPASAPGNPGARPGVPRSSRVPSHGGYAFPSHREAPPRPPLPPPPSLGQSGADSAITSLPAMLHLAVQPDVQLRHPSQPRGGVGPWRAAPAGKVGSARAGPAAGAGRGLQLGRGRARKRRSFCVWGVLSVCRLSPRQPKERGRCPCFSRTGVVMPVSKEMLNSRPGGSVLPPASREVSLGLQAVLGDRHCRAQVFARVR